LPVADATAVGPGERAGVALGIGCVDPAGVGVAGVLVHAARTTPRRRDAAKRLGFIIHRRRCCGLSDR
jgi:hypothetical protein